jgi:bifunctional non-homologous end joining protein LigD
MPGVSDKLRKYRSMRDFTKTAEPSGQKQTKAGHGYVIQKHAARRLHYDFRLEHAGVLLSWAVPKGPSLDPADHRLAARTEDHPIEYADFEGVIPEGEYGGGAVIVWDHGSWTPEGDVDTMLAKGRLTFELHGDKLQGKWHLVRTKPRKPSDKESWLLFKSRDAAASTENVITESAPASVVSGRTLEEVREAPDRVWHSNRSVAENVAAGKKAGAKSAKKGARTPAKTGPKAEKATKARPAKTTPAKGAPRRELTTSDARAITELLAHLPTKVALSNLDKPLYPDAGITKGALVAYYATMAERMLPYVGDRPLALFRSPEGYHKKGFFQKHVKDGTPDVIGRVEVQEAGGPVEHHMYVHSADGLIALVQLGVLEIHAWGCHVDAIEKPDTLVFDFDPDPAVGWDLVVEAALRLRQHLGDLGLESFVKTTGGKGLHVVAPVARRIGWDDFKEFSKSVAEQLAAERPDRFVTNMAKRVRTGKIFVDYLRNGRGATAIAPYSTRARAGATVATPISWAELEHGVAPLDFNVLTVPGRLAEPDPWAGFHDVKQSISATMRKRVKAA